MKVNTDTKKEYGRTVLGAIGAITVCALLFSCMAEAVVSAELSAKEVIPTTYNIAPLSVKESTPPEGCEKADYTVRQDDLEYFRNLRPTSKDLTMEQAAELGAQMIWELYGAELDGADIYMGYNPATEAFPRASWIGDVRFGKRTAPDGTPGTYCYTFNIDAVTGQKLNAGWGRTLAAKVSLALDNDLAKNPGEYLSLAKRLAEKHNLVGGAVKLAEYIGQGYDNNDPIITINVTGENGEKAMMSFSRYDQNLLGISFDESVKIFEAQIEKSVREAAQSK